MYIKMRAIFFNKIRQIKEIIFVIIKDLYI